MNNMKGIYIDTNIFIESILRDNKECQIILEKIINKEVQGITSILTWDELVFILRKFIGKEIAISEGEKFMRFPNLIFVDAKKEIIQNAQKLIGKYNLQPRDTIHIATAIYAGIKEIISEDRDFDIVKEIKRISPKNFN